MLVSFNPNVSNKRQQSTNFKKLPIDKIIENTGEARRFASAASDESVYKGQKIVKNDENIKDLLEAMKKTDDIEILAYLKRVAEKFWKIN